MRKRLVLIMLTSVIALNMFIDDSYAIEIKTINTDTTLRPEETINSSDSIEDSSSTMESSAMIETQTVEESNFESTETSSANILNETSEETEDSTKSEVSYDDYALFRASRRSDLMPQLRTTYTQPETIIAGSDRAKSAPRMDFIDISSHNGDLSENDFKIIKSYGIRGVVIKLTEATSYINEKAKQQIANAQKAGLIISVYHYSWFSTASDAVAEANYFADAAISLGLPKSTVLVNDAENEAMGSNISNNSLTFKQQLANRGFTNHALYTYQNWVDTGKIQPSLFGNSIVWMAAYPFNPQKDNLQHTQYSSWQWSSTVRFPGVNSTFDMSIAYNGLFINSGFTVGYDQDIVGYSGSVTADNGIWDSYYPGNRNVGYLGNYYGLQLQVIREAKINNQIWYQISFNGEVLGWVHSSGINRYKVEYDQMETNYFGQMIEPNGIWDGYWPGNKLVGNLGTYKDQELKIERSAKISGNIWYQISIDGKNLGWAHSNGIKKYKVEYSQSELNYFGQIIEYNGIWNGYWPGNKNIGNLGTYKENEVRIERSVKLSNNIWHQISIDGKILGWAHSNGFKTYRIDYEKSELNLYALTSVYNGIWDSYRPNNKLVGNLGTYVDRELKVEASAKIDGNIWYQISVNDKILGWVHSSGIRLLTLESNAVETGIYGQILTFNGIWNGYWSGNKVVGNLGTYNEKELKVNRSIKINSNIWYQIEYQEKELGWIHSSGLKTYNLEYNKKENELYGTVLVYNGIWNGYWPGNQNTGNLGTYKDKLLKIERSANINNAIWYQISYKGNVLGWVHSSGIRLQ